VQAGGRHDADEVESLFGEHSLSIFVSPRLASGRCTLDGSWIRVGNRHEFDVVDRFIPHAHVVTAHHPEADDAGA
jgi:hypothetical protein